MTRYIDVCAGQIRVALHDDGTVTWDGGNAEIDEVVRYLEQKSNAINAAAETVYRALLQLWSMQESAKEKP